MIAGRTAILPHSRSLGRATVRETGGGGSGRRCASLENALFQVPDHAPRDIDPRCLLDPFQPGCGIDLEHDRSRVRFQEIHARNVESENPCRRPCQAGGTRVRADAPGRGPLVEIGTESAFGVPALDGCGDFVSDHEIAQIPAAGFGHKALHKKMRHQGTQGFSDAFRGLGVFREHDPDALGSFNELDDEGRGWQKPQQVRIVFGSEGHGGFRYGNAGFGQMLQHAELVARPENGRTGILDGGSLDLELADHRGSVARNRGSDAREDPIDSGDRTALVVDARTLCGQGKITADGVQNADPVAACTRGLRQAARRIQMGITGQEDEPHVTSGSGWRDPV